MKVNVDLITQNTCKNHAHKWALQNAVASGKRKIVAFAQKNTAGEWFDTIAVNPDGSVEPWNTHKRIHWTQLAQEGVNYV